MKNVGIIDLQVSNLGSVINMIKKCGGDAKAITNYTDAKSCEAIILPGVGSFDEAMKRIDQMGIRTFLADFGASGSPLLGICLGMQLLLNSSEEGNAIGLGIIPGTAKKLKPTDTSLKVPHMGWSEVSVKNPHKGLSGLKSGDRFYFVHSYFASPDNKEMITLETNFGQTFASAIGKDNVLGVQFHPEKSHRFGLSFFKSYLEWIS